jgi:DNA repair protein SbcD/Mre11
MPRKLRVALTGDLHFDESSRFEDCKRITSWIVSDAVARGCGLALLSGDTFERKSSAVERLAVADFLHALTRHMPTVLVSGNHDDPLDVELLGRLDAGDHRVMAATVPRTYAIPDPEADDDVHDPIAVVHCLPWPRRAYLGELGSRDAINVSAHAALQNVLRGFAREKWSAETPSILLAHAMVRGSRTSPSQPPMVGEDFELGLEDLALAESNAVALGHIHMGQEWTVDADPVSGIPVIYPGSPRRCNYGETEPKSYVILSFDGAHLVGWERVETPAPPMVHVSARWDAAAADGAGALVMDPAPVVAGAEVRLRYDVPAEYRQAARNAAQAVADALHYGSHARSVKLEERVAVETRVRAPEITSAATTWEKLCAHWRARGGGPGERVGAVRDKFSQLEEEA